MISDTKHPIKKFPIFGWLLAHVTSNSGISQFHTTSVNGEKM